MSDRITRKHCEGLAVSYANLTGNRYAETWTGPDTWHGVLHLHDESGVKRLRVGSGSSGAADIGPGFATWRELSYFLRGMLEAAIEEGMLT